MIQKGAWSFRESAVLSDSNDIFCLANGAYLCQSMRVRDIQSCL